MQNITLEKIKGCLLGAQIGDALGMPVETMSHSEIILLNNGQGVVGFTDPIQSRIPQMAKLRAGDTTDDWQLTAVVAESIIARQSWNKADCAQKHADAIRKSTFGWGKTTENAIRDLINKKRQVGSVPENLGPNKGCGNGIAMKISPMAIYMAIGGKGIFGDMCMEISYLTHPDPRAGFAAFAVALVIRHALESQIYENTNPENILTNVINQVRVLEKECGEWRYNPDTVSGRLEKILPLIGKPDQIRQELGSGFIATETAAFTIATFLSHPTDFRAGVLEAINAGGDTDTNASIVGAMIGANLGCEEIPKEWREFRTEYQESYFLATKLNELQERLTKASFQSRTETSR